MSAKKAKLWRKQQPLTASSAQLAANQANAQLSTGPVTPEGKAAVSQNATVHGLTGKFHVLACESQAEFDQLLKGFLRSEQPQGEDEISMVHEMAECAWLSRRCVRMQNQCWAAIESGSEEEQRTAHKKMSLYMRYQTTHNRTFFRNATELRKRRNERRRVENGFVSQKLKAAAEARREQVEIRKQQLHQVRLECQRLRQQRMEINNQRAAAKLARQSPVQDRAKTMGAAA
jgi:hypothetical protein